jgi:hypothetical protein
MIATIEFNGHEDISDNVYSITTTSVPTHHFSENDVPSSSKLFHSSYSISVDPAHDIAHVLLENIKDNEVSAISKVKLRYPNMDHSFGVMFKNMPSYNSELTKS